jgi:hypothetical protein
VVPERGKLACEFAETIAFEAPPVGERVQGRAGVQTACELDPGEHEIVVAARDEIGGALGTFWGKLRVKPAADHSGPGALVWSSRSDGIWVHTGDPPWRHGGHALSRPEAEPLFVRSSYTLAGGEPGVLTLLACSASPVRAGRGEAPAPPGQARLVGAARVDLAVRDLGPGGGQPRGACRLVGAEIPPGTLLEGTYQVADLEEGPWRWAGAPVRIRVAPVETARVDGRPDRDL